MNKQLYEAVYENGVFRPLSPAHGIPEGQQVRLTVEMPTPEEMLELAAQVFEGLPEEQVDEIEKIILDRHDFFDGRNDRGV